MTERKKSLVKNMLASAWKDGYMYSKTNGYDPFKEYNIESYESHAESYAVARAEASEDYDSNGKYYVENLMNSVTFDDEFPS